MSKKIKLIISAFAVLFFTVTSSFAFDVDEYLNDRYVKFDAGYRGGTAIGSRKYFNFVNLCPTFGFTPISDLDNLIGEVSVDLNFSSFEATPEDKIFVSDISPAIKAFYYFNPYDDFRLYAGGGLDIVFQRIKHMNISLVLEAVGGCEYRFDSALSANLELTATFPSYDTIGVRGGVSYRF